MWRWAAELCVTAVLKNAARPPTSGSTVAPRPEASILLLTSRGRDGMSKWGFGMSSSSTRGFGWSTIVLCVTLCPAPWVGSSASAMTIESGDRTAPRISLSAQNPTVIARGRKLVLNGSASGVPRGTPVLIQREMESGGRGWQREGVTQVRREGTFRYSESVTRGNGSYRACLQVRGGQICSRSQLVRVIKPRSYTLSAQVVTETVEFGQT